LTAAVTTTSAHAAACATHHPSSPAQRPQAAPPLDTTSATAALHLCEFMRIAISIVRPVMRAAASKAVARRMQRPDSMSERHCSVRSRVWLLVTECNGAVYVMDNITVPHVQALSWRNWAQMSQRGGECGNPQQSGVTAQLAFLCCSAAPTNKQLLKLLFQDCCTLWRCHVATYSF